MNLRQLEHFLTVVDSGKISQAAKESGISQSGLTKSVRSLEEMLRAPLFEREARGVRPTPLGAALAGRARLIVAQWRDTTVELQRLRAGMAGTLSIGAGPSWMRRGLPEAVSRLLEFSPDLEIKIVGGFDANLVDALKQGELDVVIAACELALNDDQLEVEPLTYDRQGVIARCGHPLCSRRDLALKDITDAQWALPSARTAQRQKFDAIFVHKGLRPPVPTIESDSVAFKFEIVKATDMLGFSTDSIVRQPTQPDVASLDVPELTWRRRTGIIYRIGEHRSAIQTKLARTLHDLADEMHVN